MITSPIEDATKYPFEFNVSTRPKKLNASDKNCFALAEQQGAEAAALVALATLTASCTNADNVINANPLGPYGSNGSCEHDCSYEQTWWWKNDFRYVNNSLVSLMTIVNIANPYSNAYQPVQVWVTKDLPVYDNGLTTNVNLIEQIDAIIMQSGNETPEQAIQLSGAFATTNTILQNNINEANQGLKGIANFINQENQFINYLQTNASQYQQNCIASGQANENNLIGQIACGAGDVRNTFNVMFNDINAKFATMAVPFNTVNTNFQAALQAIEYVAGIFLSLQAKSNLVSEYISQAQSFPPTDPLRKMRLNMALMVWNSFVLEANAQLGSS